MPAWIDDVFKNAVHPNPHRCYQEPSKFLLELRHPSKDFLHKTRPPLIERNPALFWKRVALILAIIVAALLLRG